MSIRQAFRRVTLAAALAVAGGAHAQALTLEQALQAARSNLEVALARRAAQAAEADVQAADRAPSPQLSAKLSQIDLQNGLGAGSPWGAKRIDKGVGLDWTWERGDKRQWRTEAARRVAEAAGADVLEVQVQQALAAQAAWVELLAAQQRLQEVEAIAAGAAQLAQTAARRVAAGDLALQDALRADIELQRAQAEVDATRLDLARARLALAALIGRERDAAALTAAGPWPASPPLADELPDVSQAVEGRADVQAARARLQAAEGALTGARAQRQSDITWGASVDHYPGTSTRLLELRMQMPLQWGYRFEGEIARGQAQVDQAREGLEKIRRAAFGELARLHAEARAAERRARRFDDDIVPRARDVAARADLAYAKGALSLTDLLEARRTLRTALLEALAARAEQARASGVLGLRLAQR